LNPLFGMNPKNCFDFQTDPLPESPLACFELENRI
jgi:hypothetical protein